LTRFTRPRPGVGTTTTRTLESAARPNGLRPFAGETDLFIHGPFEFRSVDVLVTNFHLPRTTLLLLVGALAGGELLKRAYEEAVAREYRFFSYGDAMLVL
jgi:S-adenosylmethionine:tRNA ribosyltransferase-isomerase